MLRSLHAVHLVVWAVAGGAPVWLARLAAGSALVGGLLLLGWLALSPRHAVGVVVETAALEGHRTLARVEIPGIVGRDVLIHADPLLAGLEPGRTWLLAHGEAGASGGGAILEARAHAARDLALPLLDAAVGALDAAGWATVAAGFAAILFGGFALRLAAAGAAAVVVDALAWHALHAAAFEGLVVVAARLEPIWLSAALVLGAALGMRAAFAMPGRLMVRLGAAFAAALLAPALEPLHPFAGEAAPVLPALAFALPALVPGLAGGLALLRGLDLGPIAAPWLLLGATAAALLVDRLRLDLDPIPLAPPETDEDLARARRVDGRARRLGDWIREGLS